MIGLLIDLVDVLTSPSTEIWSIIALCLAILASGVKIFLRRRDKITKFVELLHFIATASIILEAIPIGRILSNILIFTPYILSEFITNPYFIALWFFFGIGFYRLRGTAPVTYGLGEIIVGTTAIFYALGAPGDNATAKTLTLMGGVYIIVRGLDNIDRGLPRSRRFLWDKVFPKKPQPDNF